MFEQKRQTDSQLISNYKAVYFSAFLPPILWEINKIIECFLVILASNRDNYKDMELRKILEKEE